MIGAEVEMRSLVIMIFAIFWAILLVLTGGRFLALLADANRESDLVRELYDVSQFWVEPFFNMFGLDNKAVESSGGVFEPASLLAFAAYFAIGASIYLVLTGGMFTRFRHA
jgi:hypothetical protein